MLRHNAPTPSSQSQGHDNRTTESLQKKHIFAFIVEVQRAADFDIPVQVPVIALCDSASSANWVSEQFVQDLETFSSTTFKYTKRAGRRKENEAARITIRWSCEKLGQIAEEGTFFIEPKAHFKMLFGCGYNTNPLPAKTPVYFPSQYSRRPRKRLEKTSQLSEKAADTLRQGIEAGTLLPLKIIPPMSDDSDTFKSMADMEVELDYVWRSYSFTEHLLTSDSTDGGNSSYIHSSSDQLLGSMEMFYSEPDTDDHNPTESTNTSYSEEPYRAHTLSQKLRRDRGESQQLWRLGSWMNQSSADEPLPWVPRTVQEHSNMLPFNRCHDLTPKQRLELAATRAATEKASTEYWTWDEEAKNFKHYDDGCSEPVWYNPP